MQLYFSPFACSLASHITLREAGLDAEMIPVTLSTKKTAAGDDFLAVSPKGQVPALRLDDGSVLTEGPAVVQYLADLNPASGLMPASGPNRYAVLQWLNYVSTEIHKGCFALMFNPRRPPRPRSGPAATSTASSSTWTGSSVPAASWSATASRWPMPTWAGPSTSADSWAWPCRRTCSATSTG